MNYLKRIIVLMEQLVSTCRIYFNNKNQSYTIGRIAVLKEYRGRNVGTRMLNAAEDSIRKNAGKSVMLSAQMRVSEFYEKQGYIKQEMTYFDEDFLHVWMKKDLIVKVAYKLVVPVKPPKKSYFQLIT